MCFWLYEEELHHIAEEIIWGRLTEVAVKEIDCVRHYHMEIVKKKSTSSFWEFFLTVNRVSEMMHPHASLLLYRTKRKNPMPRLINHSWSFEALVNIIKM